SAARRARTHRWIMGSSGVLPEVDVIEELRLRRWARENYVPADERSVSWHPIILEEMRRKDGEVSEAVRGGWARGTPRSPPGIPGGLRSFITDGREAVEMGFFSGRATFLRFKVNGTAPRVFGEEHLDRLADRQAGRQRIASADGVEVGWTAGDHVLDTDFE